MTTLNSNNEDFKLPETLKARCMRTEGWGEEFADKALEGYRQFMKLKIQQEDWHASILSPSLTVDHVWHQHILDVGHYVKACQDYCGHLVDHDPDGGLDEESRKERVRATQLSLRAVFGRNYDGEVWNFGDDVTSENRKRRRTSYENGDQVPIPVVSNSLSNPDSWIVVKLRDQTGEHRLFKIRRNRPLQKLFDTYAERVGVVPPNTLRFLIDGQKMEPEESPLDYEMEDQDEIDVRLCQTGC